MNSCTETNGSGQTNFLVWLFHKEEVETIIMAKKNNLSADIDTTVTHGKNKKNKGFNTKFEHAAAAITRATGSSTAFMIAIAIIIIWAGMGPVFKYSDTWQLVINTGTTIITFLMVFYYTTVTE